MGNASALPNELLPDQTGQSTMKSCFQANLLARADKVVGCHIAPQSEHLLISGPRFPHFSSHSFLAKPLFPCGKRKRKPNGFRLKGICLFHKRLTPSNGMVPGVNPSQKIYKTATCMVYKTNA